MDDLRFGWRTSPALTILTILASVGLAAGALIVWGDLVLASLTLLFICALAAMMKREDEHHVE